MRSIVWSGKLGTSAFLLVTDICGACGFCARKWPGRLFRLMSDF